MMLGNEVFADEVENDVRRLVRELDGKEKDVDHHRLEELWNESGQLSSCSSLRLIDVNLVSVPSPLVSSVRRLVLSCNQLGKSDSLSCRSYPSTLESVELGGNYFSSFSQCPGESERLQSVGLCYNELRRLPSSPPWMNVCLLDLSYNLFDDLRETIATLKNLPQLRILFLHGTPLSLLSMSRVFVIDSLSKLSVLDDVPITTEERFRCRHARDLSFSPPRNIASLTLTFPPMSNLPPPPARSSLLDEDWPIVKDRYQLRFDWFDESVEINELNIPQDKFANFRRFLPMEIQSSWTEYKPQLEFSPPSLHFSVTNLLSLRDFLFHGTRCRLIHQQSEYWPPGEATTTSNETKKKPTSAGKDKKNEVTPAKKKKNEDLSKLVIRTTPEEKVLCEFPIVLRSFLEGDHQHCQSFEHFFPHEEQSTTIPTKGEKKGTTAKKLESNQQERQKSSSSKLSKEKGKKGNTEENSFLLPPPPPEPFRCSIQFQLHHYLSTEQFI